MAREHPPKHKHITEKHPELLKECFLYYSQKRNVHPINWGGLEIPDGWLPLVDDLFTELDAELRPFYGLPDPPCISQIKSKFGGLRCFMHLPAFSKESMETMYEIIQKYEDRASSTCEITGKPDARTVMEGHWMSTLCEEEIQKSYDSEVEMLKSTKGAPGNERGVVWLKPKPTDDRGRAIEAIELESVEKIEKILAEVDLPTSDYVVHAKYIQTTPDKPAEG